MDRVSTQVSDLVDQSQGIFVHRLKSSLVCRIGEAIRDQGIDFEQLDGSRSLTQRERSLVRMREEPEAKVLLGTVGAGGVGIDLTFAQKVYLMVSTLKILTTMVSIH